MKILFLYSEISSYLLACVQALHRVYGVEVHLVRWPVNAEAPFRFETYAGITFYERASLDTAGLWQVYRQVQPALVYVSGWMDKGYQAVARRVKRQGVPVVCGIDNQWRGDLRQRLACWGRVLTIRPYYTHAWVPGLYQYEFARRLGFARERIATGMYSADVAAFQQVWEDSQTARAATYPHNLLYTGRLVAQKQVLQLCDAFLAVRRETGSDWTLTLVGTGPLKDQLPCDPAIRSLDFVQPDALPGLARSAGAFVLPSAHEPWGVVLHEFAGAGLPLLCSDACGAATAFLRHGYNGYGFRWDDLAAMQDALRQLFGQNDATLLDMGRRSYELSKQISPEIWAATLLRIAQHPG
ncbi:MAG: hypothetical protein OHK0039_47220 [Bacteroidia bacterium]